MVTGAMSASDSASGSELQPWSVDTAGRECTNTFKLRAAGLEVVDGGAREPESSGEAKTDVRVGSAWA